MRGIRKICIAAGAVGIAVNTADMMRKKYFTKGYQTGHFVGFMDGVISADKMLDDMSRRNEGIKAANTVILAKYQALLDDYNELEAKYNEVCGHKDN